MDAEHIVLSFKQAIERLNSDTLELMYVAKSEDDYIEVWIYGNQIPEQIQDCIHRIDFDFGGCFPGIIGDVHISDRRNRLMSNHATFDLSYEDSYALYKLSSCHLSPRVLAAMDELESGGGIRFDTVEELFAYLEIDEDEQASIAPSPPRTAPQAQDETHRLDNTAG